MPFDNDPEKPSSSETGDKSEVQKSPNVLIELIEKCLSTNLSYLNKAEELKKTVTQKLSEKQDKWIKSPPGAELLRINCIVETCRELLKSIEGSIRILKSRKNYFQYLLEPEDERLGYVERGNARSRNPQNLKGFGKKEAGVQVNVNYETELLNEIESAKAKMEKAAKILDVAEERYYCECERSKVAQLQTADLSSEAKMSHIHLEDSKKKQNKSNFKHLSASNTLEEGIEADAQEKVSPTKRPAFLGKGIPEKKALLEAAGFKHPSASEVVHPMLKTKTEQVYKNRLPEDATDDLVNVSKISDIHLEDSTMKENKPFSSKNISDLDTAEDDTETDKQEKVSPTKRAALIVKEIPEKKALIEAPGLKQAGTSKTVHYMSKTASEQTLKQHSTKAITDKATSSAQTLDCESKRLSIYETSEEYEIDSATKCAENKKIDLKTEASDDNEKLNVPLVSDDSDVDRLAEIDINVEINRGPPEEPEGRNEALHLEDDIPNVVEDAVGGGRWVREILEHQMNPEPEEELVDLVAINPHPEVEDVLPGNGRWVREILRRESSNE